MNIWICNPFDVLPWEGGAQRYATLAACLVEQGHTVVHWSSGFSHSFKKRRTIPEDFKVEALPYAIELVDCPAYFSNISLRRLWNHYQYGKGLVREGRWAVAEGRYAPPDLILASMPPMEGPGAALKLKQHFGCKVVLDVMDAWPQTLVLGLERSLFLVPRFLASGLLYPYTRMLRRACREADAVCAQSQAFAEYARSFGAAGEIPVFYLGAKGRDGWPDTTELVAGQPSAPVAKKPPPDPPQRSIDPPVTTRTAPSSRCYDVTSEGSRPYPNQSNFKPKAGELKTGEAATGELQPQQSQVRMLRLLYLGAMGRSYDLETLFDAVEQLNRQGPMVSLAMVGEGEKRVALEARQLPQVEFTGYLNGEVLEARLRQADVGIVPFLPGSGVAVPYKSGEYLAYGLPVISSIDGELGELLRCYACGETYTAGEAGSLVSVVAAYLQDSSKLACERAGAYKCFEAHFKRQKIYPDFAKWLGSD